MQFGGLQYSWVFLFVPLVVWFFFWADKRREEILSKFADKQLVTQLVVLFDSKKAFLKKFFLVLAIFLMALSFLQPKWGFHWEEVKRHGIDVIIALDLSKSMLAEDVKPNRLKRAQLEIKNFMNRLHGDRIGIVGFAGTSFLQCPLTLDYSTAKIFLDVMDTDLIPEPGTDIGGAIRTAISAFEGVDKKHRVLILITDGEDHGADLMDVVQEAQKKGVIIHTLAIGTQVGAPIPVQGKRGNSSFLKDKNGNVVVSKVNSESLQKIALLTGGRKGTLGKGQFPLDEIYEQEISKMEKKELDSTRQKKYENRYQWPLALALLFLIFEALLSVRKKEKIA